MRDPLSRLVVALLLALAGAGLGCAASNSSNSVSESSGSVSSLSESLTDSSASSASSLGAEESAALGRDVETTVALVGERGGDADALLRSVGALCRRRALSDWESEPAVRDGMARGLEAVGVPPREVARFARRIAGPDPAVRDALADALASRP